MKFDSDEIMRIMIASLKNMDAETLILLDVLIQKEKECRVKEYINKLEERGKI